LICYNNNEVRAISSHQRWALNNNYKAVAKGIKNMQPSINQVQNLMKK